MTHKIILMKCGHVARAYHSVTKKPFCPVCLCDAEMSEMPNLANRTARCYNFGHEVISKISRYSRFVCNTECASDLNLPFFKYQPDNKYDQFYCGCEGWD